MATVTIPRPAASEYVPYFARYIDLVPEGDVLDLLARQVEDTSRLVGALSDRDGEFRYAEGKWSIKDVLGHVGDTERILVYRALCFARGETAGLPAFDENEYVRRANFGARTIKDLVAELRTIRAATSSFFRSLDEELLARRGIANKREYTVRAIAYIIAGHERHHAGIITERYLRGLKRR